MKIFTFSFKSLLIAAGLMLGSASVWADVTVGATDCSTALDAEGSYSDSYTIKGDGSVHFTFVNHNNSGTNYQNWYLYCANNDKSSEYFRLRADNWEDKAGANTNCVSNFDWGNFVSDMNGATVDMYVSRLGSIVTVSNKITTTADKTYYYSYTYVNASMTAKITVWLGVNLSYLTISTAEPTTYTSAYSYDFNNSTHPFTYSSTNNVAIGYPSSVNGGDGNLMQESTFSADRTMSLSYAGNATFTGATDYVYEFDWNASSSNANGNTLKINGASGTLLTVSQGGNAKPLKTFTASSELATHEYASSRQLATPPAFYHFIVSASSTKGVYLTVLYNKTTVVVANQRIADFTTIASIQDVCGKSYHHVIWDDLSLKTAAPVGFVAAPTYNITKAAGTSRKFTLDCATANTTIYYAASDLEKGAAGWTEYTGEVTTAEATIYAYAKDEDDYTSSKMNFATGAGTAITLNAPSANISAMPLSGSRYYPTYNATSNQTDILGSPVATITATFNSSAVDLPYTVTTSGTLAITASAEGYTSATTNIEYNFEPSYIITKSADFTEINESNLEEKLDDTWTIAGSSTRWGSWSQTGGVDKDGTPNGGGAYWTVSTSSSFPVTVYDFVKLNQSGTQLLIGWGFGRNVSGNTNFTIADAESNAVAEYIVSNYGNAAYSVFVNNANLSYNVNSYGVVKGVKYYTQLPATVSATITAAGWTTFSSSYALDLSNMTAEHSVKAFYAYEADGSNVTLKETATTGLAAGEGVMLKGTAGDVVTIPVVASGSDIDGNILVGCPTDGTVPSGKCVFAYTKADPVGTACFYPVSENTDISAGKAYLNYSPSLAKTLRIVVDGQASEVVAPEVAETEEPEVLFNMAGIQVDKNFKGFVVNQKGVKRFNR